MNDTGRPYRRYSCMWVGAATEIGPGEHEPARPWSWPATTLRFKGRNTAKLGDGDTYR
jgi:hypothetical protein